jgi:phosphomannomutase
MKIKSFISGVIMSLKASISGIRGIVGETLTPGIIIEYVSAFSSILKEGKILIGRDSRVTGDMISSLVKGTLNACGRDVVDMGIVPTPVVLFGVAGGNGSYAGGIVITASHNPEEWNALKLVNSKGKFLSPIEFEALVYNYSIRDFLYSDHKNIGKSSYNNEIQSVHRKKILDYIDAGSIKNKKFIVALDTVNGAAGNNTVDFLNNLNCDIKPLYIEPTGRFSHAPEPTPKNLTDLSKLMKSVKTDVGFAIDPDGDRLVIADENGEVLSEELTLALCVRHYLKYYKKTDVVINLSTSRIIEDIAAEFGCNVGRVPTGEIHVTEEMEKNGSMIGGEGNGGIIAYELNKCRDALVGIGFILEMLAKENKKMSEIVKSLPSYVLIKEKFKGENLDFIGVENDIMNSFPECRINSSDGIRIDLIDSWVLARKSNTEPIIRIFAEAKTEKEAAGLIEKVKTIFKIK